MSYTVTPYTRLDKNEAGCIDAGALFYHPDRDRDIIMQAIRILQPVCKLKILLRVNNHNINMDKLTIALKDLLADDLIKQTGTIERGVRKKIFPLYSLAKK